MNGLISGRGIIAAACLGIVPAAFAGTPLWAFEPLANPSFSMSSTDTATIQYTVYNQSQKAKVLVLDSSLTPGTQQTAPCILAPKSQMGQCLLTLIVNGNTLPETGIHGGPVLCQANEDGRPNRNQCYQPASGTTLNIQKTPNSPLAPISITSGLPLYLKTFGFSQAITLTNLSTTLTANNINALFNGTPLEGYVTATTCASVAPGASCTMNFTSGRTVIPLTDFTIQGTNTPPINATLKIRESFLFVTNEAIQPYTVYRCSIEDDARVDNCIDAGGGNNFNNPVGLVINKAGTLAYVANNTGGSPVMKCDIDANGVFSSCEDAGGGAALPFNGPYGLALTADESKLYVANNQGGFVSVCPINNLNGSLGVCIEARDFQFDANSVILTPSGNYVYVTDPGAALSLPVCEPDNEGKLINCTNALPNGVSLYGPHSMAINSTASIAYITNTLSGSTSISQCSIDNNSGILDSCVLGSTTTEFETPTGIALSADGKYAYVADTGNNSISICPIRPDGLLDNCIFSTTVINGTGLQYIALH